MSGTRAGGKAAAKTNIKRYGKKFYKKIGAIGGKKGHTGGFAANRELARTAGAKGGANRWKGSQDGI
jgi:general stress protein YciG